MRFRNPFSWSRRRLSGADTTKVAESEEAPRLDSEVDELTENCQVALKYLEFFQNHDFDGYFSISEEKTDVVFGDMRLPLREMVEEMKRITSSFPDLSLTWEPCRETKPGVVVTTIAVSGTHTGKPYGFGPFPEVAAKGIHCKNSPEEVTFTISNGKITLIKTRPLGEMFGPAGFYTQIGGFPCL